MTEIQCSDWFKEIPKLILQGGVVNEEQSEYGESLITLQIRSNIIAGLFAIDVEICSVWASPVGFLHYPQFSFQRQYIGRMYADWKEGEDSRLGIGSFKTANKGILEPGIHVGGQELALSLQGEVCFKHPFYFPKVGSNPRRLTNDGERVAILQEANTYLWASALHEMSIAVVMDIAQTLVSPPMPIPDLQFVEVAVVQKTRPVSVKRNAWTGLTALAERLLPKGTFWKYIANRQPRPIDNLPEVQQDIALYLCFLQHIQYQYTEQSVFVSDYQGPLLFFPQGFPSYVIAGSTKWLTDPQVMAASLYVSWFSRRAVSLKFFSVHGVRPFGDGNVEGSVEKFPLEHTCNAWCEWFHLTLPNDVK